MTYALYDEGVHFWPVQHCIYHFSGQAPEFQRVSSARGTRDGGIYVAGFQDRKAAENKLQELTRGQYEQPRT